MYSGVDVVVAFHVRDHDRWLAAQNEYRLTPEEVSTLPIGLHDRGIREVSMI